MSEKGMSSLADMGHEELAGKILRWYRRSIWLVVLKEG